jgi:hypothetical protein
MGHKHSSVETVFGHWAPATYTAEVEAALEETCETRERRLGRPATRLGSAAGGARAATAFSDYVADS